MFMSEGHAHNDSMINVSKSRHIGSQGQASVDLLLLGWEGKGYQMEWRNGLFCWPPHAYRTFCRNAPGKLLHRNLLPQALGFALPSFAGGDALVLHGLLDLPPGIRRCVVA